MVEFCVQRKGSILLPISGSDERELWRLPERRVFSIEAHPKAPLKLSRWYRAGVQLLVESTGRWPNAEIAHKEIMMQAKYFEAVVVSMDGKTDWRPSSQMGWDLVQWQEFLNAAVPIMLDIAGESQAKFRDRVDKFFGLKLKEIWEG